MVGNSSSAHHRGADLRAAGGERRRSPAGPAARGQRDRRGPRPRGDRRGRSGARSIPGSARAWPASSILTATATRRRASPGCCARSSWGRGSFASASPTRPANRSSGDRADPAAVPWRTRSSRACRGAPSGATARRRRTPRRRPRRRPPTGKPGQRVTADDERVEHQHRQAEPREVQERAPVERDAGQLARPAHPHPGREEDQEQPGQRRAGGRRRQPGTRRGSARTGRRGTPRSEGC